MSPVPPGRGGSAEGGEKWSQQPLPMIPIEEDDDDDNDDNSDSATDVESCHSVNEDVDDGDEEEEKGVRTESQNTTNTTNIQSAAGPSMNGDRSMQVDEEVSGGGVEDLNVTER